MCAIVLIGCPSRRGRVLFRVVRDHALALAHGRVLVPSPVLSLVLSHGVHAHVPSLHPAVDDVKHRAHARVLTLPRVVDVLPLSPM